MFKTERMKQVVIAGAKPQLVPVIQTLQKLQALHIEEHRPDEFFAYGTPLPEGSSVASARLTSRGLIKSLGLESQQPPGPATDPATDIPGWEEAVDVVEDVDRSITGLVKELERARSTLREHEQAAARLKRMSGLDVRLEHLGGYKNLAVFFGTTPEDPEAAIKGAVDPYHLQKTPDPNGTLIALFVPKHQAERAENALAQEGFQALEVPQGEGPVESAAGQTIKKARQVRTRLETLENDLQNARKTHGARLLKAEKVLAAAAERANAPLKFASSTHGFVVTGFVPAGRTHEAERALQHATGHSLYIEWSTPTDPRHGHAGEKPAEESAHPAGHAPDKPIVPPSRFTHKRKGPNAFTHMLTLHSHPKYKEIDPTILMYITFPLFFAVMIGDLAFGVLIMLVAAYLKNHYPLGMGGPKVSRMLMLAGLWTTIFGVFVYQEAFGMHFIQSPGSLSWEAILVNSGAWGGYESAHGLGLATVTYTLAGLNLETHYISKLGNVELLLGISLGLALLHLVLAILIGVYNQWIMHGAKHAILGRVSWLIMIAGILALAGGLFSETTLAQSVGWGLLVLSVVMIIAGEGVIGALELPKILSNALSYFRLAAVAMSKAGMALAVNTFAFVQLTDTSWAVNGIGGWIMLIVGHAIVLALGIIAGGLHSMRLQLVEFFNWFYEGGGRPFKPFGDPNLRQ